MSEIQKIKYSIASLLRKEFAARIPADGTSFTLNYYDFEAGANTALETLLNSIRNVYTYPVFCESEFPYCEVTDLRLGFPQATQQKEDQTVRLQIAVWDTDLDQTVLDRKIEAYGDIVKDILNEYEDQIRTKNLLIKIKISDGQLNVLVANGAAWIRPTNLILEIKTQEN